VRKRVWFLVALLAVTGIATTSGSARPHDFGWQLTPTGSTARLRGLSAVSAEVAWASGSAGTVLRTVNRGATWQNVSPPGTTALDFRDIEAFDADRAVILAIGPGAASQIYVTADAGRTWQRTFLNDDPNAFYDCMTFFDQKRGLALSDPVDGRFRILATSDGGRSWRVVDADMPPALPNEFAFAASGQCLVSDHGHRAWFGTGGADVARVFRSDDRGQTWQVSTTPMHSGPIAGVFALAFRGQQHGFAVGGDLGTPAASPDMVALTSDGGVTWQLVPAANAPNQYRSGAHWVTGRHAVAVGPTGSDSTSDGGRTWVRFDDGSFDTVDCANPGACWASGVMGRAAYLVRSR
jgi:photosystem II stability/assembly factor-like uncharacterized protein